MSFRAAPQSDAFKFSEGLETDGDAAPLNEHSHASALSPLPGTGRLGIVSGYFTVVGSAAALGTLGIAYMTLRPEHGTRTVSAKDLALLFGALSLTFGCFRTSRLLDRRKREGVAGAIIMLAAPIVGYSANLPPSLAVVVASVTGVALLGSVWRYLAD